MEGRPTEHESARRIITRELGALRRGRGLTDDALRAATTSLALDVVRRAAAARRMEPYQALDLLVREWLGGPVPDEHRKALLATIGISLSAGSAAKRRREYRDRHPILTADDSVKYHEEQAICQLASWLMEEDQIRQPVQPEIWSSSDYHPPAQIKCKSGWDRYRIGFDRRPILNEVDRIFTGRRNNITRITFVGRYSGGNDALIPEVVEGGTYDGVIMNQTSDGFRRYGIVLDRVINEGDEFRVRWQFRYDHSRSLSDPLPLMANIYEVEQLVSFIDIIFDPRAIPWRVYSAVAPAGSWPRRGEEPVQVEIAEDYTARASWRSVPKDYAAGLYWEWPI